VRVVISDTAQAELQAIGDWIAIDNPARAVSFMKELRDAARGLADMPLRFPMIDVNFPQPIRRRVLGRYVILYTVGDARVDVLHILHGARDYHSLLDIAPDAD
jgi:toxin ParE1/3/4